MTEPTPKSKQKRKLLGLFTSKPKTRRQKLAKFLVIGVPAFLVILAISAELTSRPRFCRTCHYMEPYYTSWEESAHSDVSCVTCHFPPGIEGTIRGKMEGLVQVVNYAASTYTRRTPWAEIGDESCLQSECHDTRTLEGEVTFHAVVFDHADHLGEMRRGKQLRCTSCHSQVVQGEHILVTESTCFLCHFKPDPIAGITGLAESVDISGHPVTTASAAQDTEIDAVTFESLSNCKTCHKWEAIPDVLLADFRFDHSDVIHQDIDCRLCHNRTVIGDGFVPRENCVSCHHEAERLDQYDDIELMHRIHIADHKIECQQCHLTIQHKIQFVSSETELECTTCHTSSHSEQLALYTGKGGNGLEGEPNPMFDVGLNCASCHVFHEQMMGNAEVNRANESSCDTCHGTGYSRLLELWENVAEDKIVRLQQVITRVERTVRNAGTRASTEVQAYIDLANNAMHLVQVGKAVHNITFAELLIGKGYENLNLALETVGADYRLSGWETSSVVPSECANCHTGIETITTPYLGRSFSHSNHLVDQGIACQTCHSNAQRHGQMILPSERCTNCHHSEATVDNPCEHCHSTEAAYYAGTFSDSDLPDYMFDEDIVCEDCHEGADGITVPETAVCVDCHDDSYEEMATEWKTEIQELVAEIGSLLDSVTPDVRSTSDYRQAVMLLQAVRSGSANGIHNYELTLELLEEIRVNF